MLEYSLGIFVGFASFFMMEKTLRVLGGDDESHGHSHSHSTPAEASTITASGAEPLTSGDGLRARKSEKEEASTITVPEEEPKTKGPSKMSAYLNLFGDFVHNMFVIICFPSNSL